MRIGGKSQKVMPHRHHHPQAPQTIQSPGNPARNHPGRHPALLSRSHSTTPPNRKTTGRKSAERIYGEEEMGGGGVKPANQGVRPRHSCARIE